MKNKTMRTGQNDTRNVKWTLHRLSKLIENQKKIVGATSQFGTAFR